MTDNTKDKHDQMNKKAKVVRVRKHNLITNEESLDNVSHLSTYLLIFNASIKTYVDNAFHLSSL